MDRAECKITFSLVGQIPLRDFEFLACETLLDLFLCQVDAKQMVELRGQRAFTSQDAIEIQLEAAEVRAAIQTHASSQEESDHTHVREEIGDLLFAVTNIARHLKVEPEAALKLTNRKFRRRFHHIEEQLGAQQRSVDSATLDELESLWQAAKKSD